MLSIRRIGVAEMSQGKSHPELAVFRFPVVLMWYFGGQVRDQHKTTSNTYDISVNSE